MSTSAAHNADVVMTDAIPDPEIDIANKVKADLRIPEFGTWVDKDTDFRYDPLLSSQLSSLRIAEVHEIDFNQVAGEGSKLYGCNVGDIGSFLGLSSVLKKFYIRDGYDALFAKIKTCWQDNETKRVTLIGNPGTGKSWYQVYILRELLRNRSGYKYIIRHVGKLIYIIDLEQSRGYLWHFQYGVGETIVDQVKDAVYLYEPAQEKDQPPMGLLKLPSLATLSPYSKRITEYKKINYIELYFWPWSFSAMNAMAQDSERNTEDLLDRYLKFGGVLRHVLAKDVTKASSELTERLANVSLRVLQSKALNIYRDDSGNNVSGYILCYNNKQNDESRFTRKVLEFTSLEVESRVTQIIDDLPVKDKATAVLARLNDQGLDLSNMNLEAVGTELLSKGTHGTPYKWQSKEVGDQDIWSTFNTNKRDVVRLWEVYELLQRKDQILVSTNPNFPLGDIVFTPDTIAGPISVVQFTWQSSHPFTIRALYDLRVNRLRVGHEVCVKVHIVPPGLEDYYAGMKKTDFLMGDLSEPFKWSRNTAALEPDILLTMWNSTEVHVIRPVEDWKTLLGNFIKTL
jgi:hypothetical protein